MGLINRYEFEVEAYQADLTGRLHLNNLVERIQILDSQNSESLGFTNELFEEKNIVWMLINDYMVFYKNLPRVGDKVIIKTGFGMPKGAKFYREDKIYIDSESEHNLIARNSSTWIITDKDTRMVKRPSYIFTKDEYREMSDETIESPYNIEDIAKSSKDLGKLERILTYKALFSDLDFNVHMHNTNYIKLAIDAYVMYKNARPDDFHIDFQDFNIEYKREVLMDDILELYIYESQQYVYIEGRSQEGELSFLVKFRLRNQ